ncbi:MAG: cytochrome c3 family protein [Arenimonas sp.]
MKRSRVLSIIAINLAVLITLVFVFPHLMISPGPVIAAHSEIGTDCFACHSALRGISPERCQSCHVMKDIGIRSTDGKTLSKGKIKLAFHQQLLQQDCTACHSDHVGPALTKHSRKSFSHALIKMEVRTKCDSCHTRPDTNLHRNLNAKVACNQCHSTDAWKRTTFNHDLLAKNSNLQCDGCHRKPKDDFHQQVQGNCQQCHGVKQWKPSTFNHDKFFMLDRDHNVACSTCHVDNNLSRYTCYGCHEHTPAKIRAEHVKEGIRNFDNCVKCHRSPDDEGGGRREDSNSGDDD